LTAVEWHLGIVQGLAQAMRAPVAVEYMAVRHGGQAVTCDVSRAHGFYAPNSTSTSASCTWAKTDELTSIKPINM
jgi:hypothetical protein